MKRLLIPCLSSALFLFSAGCSDTMMQPMHEKSEEEKEVKIVKMQDTLFCFKCHSKANFNGRGGKFPHVKHKALLKDMTGVLHCNQCHDIKGHHKIVTISKKNAPCNNCH